MVRWQLDAASRRWLETGFRVVCIVGTVLALAWYVRDLKLRELGDILARASLVPLALAVLANIGVQYLRAAGWLAMLGPHHPVPLGRLVRYEFTAQAASAITPAQAGEVVRVWLLKRHDGVPATTTGALIVLEKLFGALGMVVLVTAVPWLLPGLPPWVALTVILFAVAMVLLLAVLVVAARRSSADRAPTIIRRFFGGMYMLRDTRRMIIVLVLAVLGEAADLAGVVAVLQALDIDLSLAAATLILFLIDLVNLLPSTPARIGTFEVASLSAFGLFPVGAAGSLAFALIFHVQQVLPQTLIGLPFVLRLPLERMRKPEPLGETEPGEPDPARPGGGT